MKCSDRVTHGFLLFWAWLSCSRIFSPMFKQWTARPGRQGRTWTARNPRRLRPSLLPPKTRLKLAIPSKGPGRKRTLNPAVPIPLPLWKTPTPQMTPNRTRKRRRPRSHCSGVLNAASKPTRIRDAPRATSLFPAFGLRKLPNLALPRVKFLPGMIHPPSMPRQHRQWRGIPHHPLHPPPRFPRACPPTRTGGKETEPGTLETGPKTWSSKPRRDAERGLGGDPVSQDFPVELPVGVDGGRLEKVQAGAS